MAVDTVARSRRAVLIGALGAVAASVGAAIGRPVVVRAADPYDVVLGASNASTSPTTIAMTGNSGAAFRATNPTASGLGIQGEGDTGVKALGGVVGVDGRSQDNGIRGLSLDNIATTDFNAASHNTGVIGAAGIDASQIRTNTDETGVYGFASLSAVSTGVWGDSPNGYGVYGSGDIGTGGMGFIGVDAIPDGTGSMGLFAGGGSGQTGAYAYAGSTQAPTPARNTALEARAGSTAYLALNVVGKTRFSRSGRTTVAAGGSTKTVTMAGVSTSSYIIATLQTNRTGVYVQAVVPASGSFKIYLNKAVSASTVVGYLVIN